ncbi:MULTISPECIES: ABC transporter substrate-binding protein [Streptomyces]|uniref:Fe3+-hydroxamate ABC transporter n=1 Tax=Streptomyces violaceoruber TaxID=1935 RepID=A0A1V0UBI2_STRVN|nr:MULTISPECIES: ABC transporter substrate-binding protein [Streptomyces]MYW80410.1 ABC transporter substrate-binding protein [Streptomyces sp. SID8369]NEA12619.1 ABC transporter substrate-binding protein [Streptomyces sp. SID10692]NEC40661.1 ABC transporter substrate-binding protein [Streptomyces sp. SID8016]ARF62457.1 Fe3+-hydroxamate ABC transporter [Streptomyces violaceoruber]MBD3555047.1 ABC transporter substrate-binding protein [Streptomyces sp. SP18CM02]
MTRVRRLTASAATGLALALAATACGTTDVSSASGSKASASASPASKDCAADTTATSTKPVTLTDSLGREVKLDKPAKRIAVLEWQQVEDALTLCVTPVAVSDAKGYRTWVSAEKLPEGVKDIGTREEPDLDALAAADPDLVVVEAFDAKDKKLAALEKRGIPVIATKGADPKDPIGNVRDVFNLIGEATGRTERAEQVVGEFDAHLAAAKKKVADAKLPTQDFLFFDGWLQGGNLTVRPYGKGALFTAIGEELGMKSAWTDEINKAYGDGGVDPAYGLAQTDVEGLAGVGEANLFYANDEGAGGYVKALEKNPVWKSLPAVKEGRAHSFPSGVWGAGGPRSCEQAIDAYVDAITKK